MATTTLHEFTHAPGVYSPGTEDNGYGYSAATALTSANAVLNADSYALYANGTFSSHHQCPNGARLVGSFANSFQPFTSGAEHPMKL